MQKLSNHLVICMFFVTSLLTSFESKAQGGAIIHTDERQQKLVSTYRYVLERSEDDYLPGQATNSNLFPDYGETSVYRIISGENAGSFVSATSLPNDYANCTYEAFTDYDVYGKEHVSIQFKKQPKKIAIFKSQFKSENTSINWEAIYFERLFSEFLMDNLTYTIDEETLSGEGLDENTALLIIPAFLVKDEDYTFYIDSILSVSPDFKSRLDDFLNLGGSIYAEGNAAYYLEQLGFLESNTVDYSVSTNNGGNQAIAVNDELDLLSLGAKAAGNKLYCSQLPQIDATKVQPVISTSSGNSCIFRAKSSEAKNGSIVCNTGLPTVAGLTDPYKVGDNQLSWTLNSILEVFSHKIDATRKVENEIIFADQVGDNSISYDRTDTFVVNIRLRNLSNENKTVSLNESINGYFTFLDVTSGESYVYDDHQLTFSDVSLSPLSEKIITYRLITPDPDSDLHEDIDQYMGNTTLINASDLDVEYQEGAANKHFTKNKNNANVLFSARIFADTDVNWKNFLGLDYQPFKVFMIMENKSRSTATNTEYIQYIPKDVPFYQSDNSIDIPILKTPGGKFIDILKGSDDEKNPEYDLDSDGKPDVWLDTASIFPKGYTITEEKVYWANPWNHLRTGDKSFVFEDIDGDGVVPTDTDGDGIVDSNEDEDDKIRVYKVTWDIGNVKGYEYYDPYCSYEIWVDPPDFIPLCTGVGYVFDSISNPYPGMFYPYTENILAADKNDTTWAKWMEHNDDGSVKWRQFIHQKMNNYEGFTFVDTSTYILKPYDSLIGTAPQPHREFLAVLSLGGEEIDMYNWVPTQSLYSKVKYETVFEEERIMPIRTTYSYYAPLPNPLQFEYLSNNYDINEVKINGVSNSNANLKELPEWGTAQLQFDMDASTEYSYYWVRNVGHDVDYNDPSEAIDGIAGYGDGVFGYFVYTIPKGMGGYKINLAKNEDGSFNTDSIVQVDGKPFTKWLDNENTGNEVEIWESPFQYDIYIPQILIPPALDDDNADGIDDWIDDRGDRFCSKTGFLHDAFMPGNGEDYLNFPADTHYDGDMGKSDSGWYCGADTTYGDDYFETLGKTHFTIHAEYEGRGREGSVEISKGGVLVVEEIFGGSPWVIFSHVLSGFAQGSDISLESKVSPELVYYGVDTVYLKHTIADTNEPHFFNYNFDPYHISYGYKESTITTYVGAKDPSSLIDPVIEMPAIIDPDFDQHSITLIPHAGLNPDNPDLTEYPRDVSGCFVEVRIEVGNSTDNNWINTCVKPQLSSEIGSIEMSYVVYPRPLVPSHYEGGKLIPGDQPATFSTGWRFNQPEGEVLVKMGDTLNLLQPSRKAYFVYLVKINESIENGIYNIPFTISGKQIYYDGTVVGDVSYEVPDAKFSIVDKNGQGLVTANNPLVLNKVQLGSLQVSGGKFVPTGENRYSIADFDPTQFNSISDSLIVNGNTIDLSKFKAFPSVDTNKLVIMQKGVVDSYNSDAEIISISNGQLLNYSDPKEGEKAVSSEPLVVRPIGPRVKISNSVYSINGLKVSDAIMYEADEALFVLTQLSVKNTGTDISKNTIIQINPGPYFKIATDSLNENCSVKNNALMIDMGDVIPGERKQQYLPFFLNSGEIPEEVDIRTIIDAAFINYEGTLVDNEFKFMDPKDLLLDVYDFEALSITFSDLGNGQVEVSAEAHNRGIKGENVWLRIYPVVGNGVHEFAIAEIKKDAFMPGESIDLKGVYNVPQTNQSIRFIAIIDDAQKFTEISELNNSISVSYVTTSVDDLTSLKNEHEVYPNPFVQQLTFNYFLQEGFSDVNIKVYSMNGELVQIIENCPVNTGINSVSWQNSDLMGGSYIYQINGLNSSGSYKTLYKGTVINKSN